MAAQILWIGTYTPGSDPTGSGTGIHRVEFDTVTGRLSGGAPLAATPGPSFLAAHPDGRSLYAVNEKEKGTVTGFAVGADGTLTERGSAPTGGTSPCHLAVHPRGRHVIATNYADGVVSVHPITDDGAPGEPVRLLAHTGSGPDTVRQEGPHAHTVGMAPDGRHLLVADLGTDEVRCYAFDPDADDPVAGESIAARLTPGTGPRHMAVHPNGHIYVAGELDSRIHVLRWDRDTATTVPVADVPATGVAGVRSYPAEIVLSRDGERLYVSNRGADTIASFEVTEGGSGLRHLADTATGGSWPRHFALLEGHIVVANQYSGGLAALCLDPSTGIPTDTGHRLALPDPVCVLPAAG
ncbi:MAG: lactonase family protein [Nocardiopsaceae bacterium]|nr:lactonase family protein [Nocardiopsaceae bacterium]